MLASCYLIFFCIVWALKSTVGSIYEELIVNECLSFILKAIKHSLYTEKESRNGKKVKHVSFFLYSLKQMVELLQLFVYNKISHY